MLGVYILAHGGERFTEMTVDSLIKTLMQNFTFFTKASRFKTFESWFLQYIEYTKRMIESHGNITFHHLMIANAILALDHMARYKTWMRNKRAEFPQRLSEIYADAPKFLNCLLQDIRRLDATRVTHNDNPQAKFPHSEYQEAMITCLLNRRMLVDSNLSKKSEMWSISKDKTNLIMLLNFSPRLMSLWVLKQFQRLTSL